jgi:hypothetical protein
MTNSYEDKLRQIASFLDTVQALVITELHKQRDERERQIRKAANRAGYHVRVDREWGGVELRRRDTGIVEVRLKDFETVIRYLGPDATLPTSTYPYQNGTA